jgi:hypothetical protein
MLKIKQKLHYRKVGKNDPKTCWHCGHRKLIDIHSCAVFHDGESSVLKQDYRCEVLGLKGSIRYAVRTGHVCDRFAYFPITKKYYAEK